MAAVPLAAFISVSRRGDLRVAVSPAVHLVEATMLYLTIDFVRGVTVHLTMYRLRAILGSRRGWFDVVELSHSRSSCIVVFGRPSCLPEEPIHGEWKGAIWRSQLALLHLPVRRVIEASR